MTALLRTRAIARPLSYVTTVALLGYPLALIIGAMNGLFSEPTIRDSYDVATLPAVIPMGAFVVVYATSITSMVIVMLVLWNMRALLLLYAMGDVLGAETALRIRSIGHCLLALAIWGVLAHTLNIAALTWGNPSGERALSIAVGNNDLFLFLAAGLMTVIGWAMSEAARVADENRSFV